MVRVASGWYAVNIGWNQAIMKRQGAYAVGVIWGLQHG
jgi:hypothetical protein